MKKIEIYGGFHNVDPIRLRVSSDAIDALEEGGWSYFFDKVSLDQGRRLWRHMCGVAGCMCEPRDWEYEVCNQK